MTATTLAGSAAARSGVVGLAPTGIATTPGGGAAGRAMTDAGLDERNCAEVVVLVVSPGPHDDQLGVRGEVLGVQPDVVECLSPLDLLEQAAEAMLRQGRHAALLVDDRDSLALVVEHTQRADQAVRPRLVVAGHGEASGQEHQASWLTRSAVRSSLPSAGGVPAVDCVQFISDAQDASEALAGLASEYAVLDPEPGHCILTGTGSTEPLAQLAGLVAALQKAQIPSTPPDLREAMLAQPAGAAQALAAVEDAQPWLPARAGGDRVGALLSLVRTGGGGLEVGHLVLRCASGPHARPDVITGAPFLLVLSGQTPAALAYTAAAAARLLEHGTTPAQLISTAAAADKAELGRLRLVLVANSTSALLEELRSASQGVPQAATDDRDWATPRGSFCTFEPLGRLGKVALVYPGLSSVYRGAGADLLARFPLVRDELERAPRPRERYGSAWLFPSVDGRRRGPATSDSAAMLTACANLSVLLTRLVQQELRLRVDGCLGYSLGEISMLYAQRVWQEADADERSLSRSPLFDQDLAGRREVVRRAWRLDDTVLDDQVWTSLLLLCRAQDVRKELNAFDRVFLTHVNTPDQVVIAGDPDQCARLVDRLACQAYPTPATPVMHCPLVAPVLEQLVELADQACGAPPGVPDLYATAETGPLPPHDVVAVRRRVAGVLGGPVDFPALLEQAYADGYRYFVEAGPGGSCSSWTQEVLAGRPHIAVALDRPGCDSLTSLARAAARLISNGLAVDTTCLQAPVAPLATPTIQLPVTPAPSAGDDTTMAAWDTSTSTSTLASNTTDSSDDGEGRIEVEPHLWAAVQGRAGWTGPAVQPLAPPDAVQLAQGSRSPRQPVEVNAPEPATRLRAPGVLYDEQDLLEFAKGKVGAVFGPAYASTDRHRTRVRLPAPPYLFVSRVLEIRGTRGVFEPSSITIEYDFPDDPWYGVDGRAPFAVTFEVGQASLLLLSHLGVDDLDDGRVYRLLGGSAVFHGDLPRAGQTLRYEVSIDRFLSTADGLMFTFSYRCYDGTELVLEMIDGSAGFFTQEELDSSPGIVLTAFDRKREQAMGRATFKPLARTERTSLERADLELLAAGRADSVFGPSWDQRDDGCNPSVRLPSGRMLVLDRVSDIDRLGGPRGLGRITGEMQVSADDWYFACHFTDDPVLPGSLTVEGGAQLLQVYAMYLGLHLVLPDVDFQPALGRRSQVKVRGQVTPSSRTVRYVATVTDISLLPRPTLVADICVYDGDRMILRMQDFGLQLREKPGTPYRPELGGRPASFLGRRNSAGDPAVVNELHLAHLTKGDLATAMGPEFEIYNGRTAPHVPNGDFQFLDRIMALEGTRGQQGVTRLSGEYDCPPDAWYRSDAPAGGLPLSGLLETALQSAVMTGYYMGATLASPRDDLAIRNLDGHQTLLRDVVLAGKTIRTDAELISTHTMPGAILQRFDYVLSVDQEPFLKGQSLFGYFTRQMLADQQGLDGGKRVPTWLDGQHDRVAEAVDVSGGAWRGHPGGVGLGVAQGKLGMLDRAQVVAGGGRYSRGYVQATRTIRPDDWYFACHFHQDPVMPGSLGLEALAQALQGFVLQTGLADEKPDTVFAMPTDVETAWKYRGQILPDDTEMRLEVHVKDIRRDGSRLVVVADGSVWKQDLRIYEVTGLAIEVRQTGGRHVGEVER